MENLFFYSKTIDKQVTVAVQKILKVPEAQAVKLAGGEVNHVYRVTAQNKEYLVRVFKNKFWPEDGKLLWIEKQLAKRRIPHAKILHYSRASTYFPFGLMISEFLEGVDGGTAVRKRKLTLAQAYEYIGSATRKVHSIHIKKFGHVNNGKGAYVNFLKWKTDKVHERFAQFELTKEFESDIAQQVEMRVKGVLSPFVKRFSPVLVHGDPNRDNAVWTKDKQWVLIDWDNARAGIWLEDYADISFWIQFKGRSASVRRGKLALYRKHFFTGYGKVSFRPREIERIEYGLHILQCVNLLPYYYFNKKNLADFKATKKRLYQLLKNKEY